MAKVSVEFDTVEKTLSCSIDGKAVDNVHYVSMSHGYMNEEDFTCSITTMMHDEAEDIKTYTQLIASESKDSKKNKDFDRQSAIAGFIERPLVDEVVLSIREAFGVK